MGRGRQKAMAKKIAREVKYSSPDTDYESLVDELQSGDIKDEFENLKTGYEPDKKQSSDSVVDMTEEELADYLEWVKSTTNKNN